MVILEHLASWKKYVSSTYTCHGWKKRISITVFIPKIEIEIFVMSTYPLPPSSKGDVGGLIIFFNCILIDVSVQCNECLKLIICYKKNKILQIKLRLK